MLIKMKVCRLHRTWLIGAILVNLLILLYLVIKQHTMLDSSEENRSFQKTTNPLLSSDLTIVLREFEHFENDVVNTVLKIQETFSDVKVVVIGDKSPYPPWRTNKLDKSRFHYISLEGNLWDSALAARPETVIKTEYVLLMPDATWFQDGKVLKTLTDQFVQSNMTLLAVPFKGIPLHCSSLKFNAKEWTLEYIERKTNTLSCNNIVGEHAVIMRTQSLFEISLPYLRPWPLSLYIQGSLHQWTIKVADTIFLELSRQLFETDVHNKWKHKHNLEQRIEHLYHQLGIKLVTRGNNHKQWYGCSKETERCFDTVVEDMPEYLYMKRWTPPCCLKALRETARHVFEILDLCSSRYWLEGGSLLGAARHNDIIPWDYDVDIGIYLEDVDRCDYLLRCKEGTYVDEEGFVWERAREGDFYRVQYSESNRLHVDIFPFFSSNGTMTKNTWIKTHRQDTEFPERFLKPLTKIRFAGMNVNTPNNIREFLEFKFGPGVIEHPKYPNSQDPV